MKNKKHDTKTPSDSAEEIAQTEMPRATAEEIAQKVIIKVKNPPSDEEIEKAREKEEWLRIRREEALRIDAQTAEVFWIHAYGLDPYGVEPDLPPEYQQVGREYFARRPGCEIWVSFHDLPKATCEALWGPQFKRWEEECLRRDGELPVLYFRFAQENDGKTMKKTKKTIAP